MIACLGVWIACTLGVIDPDRFYSAPELWRESHAPRQAVYEALDSGELRAIRRGRRWLIPGASAIDWMRRLSEAPRG